MYESICRITSKDIVIQGSDELKTIECILLAHKYDNMCIYLTIPPIFELDLIKGDSLPRTVL